MEPTTLWERSGYSILDAVDGRAYIRDSGALVSVGATSGGESWRVDCAPDMVANVVGDLVYLRYPDGRIDAFDVATGERRWTVNPPADSVTIGDLERGAIVVYEPFGEYRLYGFDVETGSRRAMFVGDGKLHYIGARDGVVCIADMEGVYGINLQTDSLQWRTACSPARVVRESVAVADSSIVGSNAGIAAYNWFSGAERWFHRTDGSCEYIEADEATVYGGTWGRSVYAVDTKSGHLRWQFSADDSIWSLERGNRAVYVGSQDNGLYALDPDDGTERWRFETGGDVAEIHDADDVVYAGSDDGNLYAVDAETGRGLWSFATDRWPPTPKFVNGLTVISHDGVTYGFDSRRGTEVWSKKDVTVSLIAGDVLYAVSSGTVTAYDVSEAGDTTVYGLSDSDRTRRTETRVFTERSDEQAKGSGLYCPNCGTDYGQTPDASFCRNCGTEL